MAELEGEFLARNKNRAYPFVDSNLLFLAPYANQTPDDFFLDGYMVYSSTNTKIGKGNYWLIKSINIVDWELTLVASNDPTTTIAVTITNNTDYDDYKTLTWISSAENITVCLVLWKSHPLLSETPALLQIQDSDGNVPDLVVRGEDDRSRRVEDLNLSAFSWATSGEVADIAEGTNIQIDVDPDTPRIAALKLKDSPINPNVTRVVITADPGLGTGRRQVDCSLDGSIYSINNNKPKNGNIQIAGDACYRVGRPDGNESGPDFVAQDIAIIGDGTGLAPNTVQIHNDCQICCDCADFVVMLNQIRELKDKGLEIKNMWKQVKAAFDEVLAEWALKTNCIDGKCSNQLYAYSFTGWLVSVQLYIANPNNCSKPGADVSFVFSGGDYDTLYVPGTGMVYNGQSNYVQTDPSISGNTFTMSDNSGIEGGGYKIFLMSVRMKPSNDRVDGANVLVNANVTACGGELENLNTLVSLKGNTSKA